MALTPPPISKVTESLFAAIRANDLSRVEAALAAGAEINGDEVHHFAIDRTLYEGSNTPLSLAIRLRHLDIAHRLLTVPGIEVDRGSCFAGETPLMIAAREGHADTAERLLAAGADPNCEDKYELCTAATFAIRGRYAGLAIRLIEAGTDLGRFGQRLLCEATNFRLDSVIALLTARGVAPLTRKEARRTIDDPWPKPSPPPEPPPPFSDEAFFRAAEEGDTKLLRTATAWGFPLNLRRAGGETPLMAATRCGQSQAAMILIEGGASIWLRDDNGEDALMIAERLQRSAIAAALRRKLRQLD